MAFLFACSLNDLSENKIQKLVVDDLNILVVKTSENHVWCFDYFCTHADKSLEKGRWDAEQQSVMCPFHKAIFSLKDAGKVLTGPACIPLKVYPTEIRQTSTGPQLFVELD